MNLSLRGLFNSSFIYWVIGALFILFYLFTFDGFKMKLRPDRVKFGIDLVGGTYITLGVQTDKAIETELSDKVISLNKKLQTERIAKSTGFVVKDQAATLKFEDINSANAAEQFIRNNDSTLTTKVEGTNLKIELKETYARSIKDSAIESNIQVLRTRLGDTLGIGEVLIAPQGEKNIIIELPNVDDPQKAKAMIGKAALLEIKLVERVANSPEDLLDEYDGELPEGMMIVSDKEKSGFGKHYYLVPAQTDLTGRLLKDAFVGFGGPTNSEVVVNFRFNPEGGEKFYELTKSNYGKQVAILIDGTVISAPRVNSPIGAEGYIHGDFTMESASELASLLKSGAFVAPVTFEAEQQIGPSLGQESIHQGLLACGVGLLLLLIFSIAMYKTSGLFACIALVYNLLLVLFILSFLHATLTLPGIAGMVLTVGMAIDASILIYEHIREELAAGVTTKKAVLDGFSGALEVILDSNITTFIVGLVLFKFGTGPIQGFAVTMMVGIVATLLTGLFFLRSLFMFTLQNLGVQKIKI